MTKLETKVADASRTISLLRFAVVEASVKLSNVVLQLLAMKSTCGEMPMRLCYCPRTAYTTKSTLKAVLRVRSRLQGRVQIPGALCCLLWKTLWVGRWIFTNY